MANSRRKCAHCKASKQAGEMFITGLQAFCNKQHYIDYAGSNIAKLAKKGQSIGKKINAVKKREFKENDISHQRKLTQDAFNKMRRLEELHWFKSRNIEPYCISCQKPLGGDVWACGHYKTRGARKDLALDKLNTYLQHNFSCNSQKSGDVEGVKRGLIMRFGEEEAQRIIDYCEAHQQQPKRTCDDYIAMRKEYNAEIKRLQSLL